MVIKSTFTDKDLKHSILYFLIGFTRVWNQVVTSQNIICRELDELCKWVGGGEKQKSLRFMLLMINLSWLFQWTFLLNCVINLRDKLLWGNRTRHRHMKPLDTVEQIYVDLLTENIRKKDWLLRIIHHFSNVKSFKALTYWCSIKPVMLVRRSAMYILEEDA